MIKRRNEGFQQRVVYPYIFHTDLLYIFLSECKGKKKHRFQIRKSGKRYSLLQSALSNLYRVPDPGLIPKTGVDITVV